MNLRPFNSKRRPKRPDLWGLKVKSDIDPISLMPSGKAKHEVSMVNKDTMTYELTFDGSCGPLLRYGSAQTWGPVKRELSPDDGRRSIKTEITLPASCDVSQLPTSEEVRLKTHAKPMNPEIISQEAAVNHDLDLKLK
jgi:hypothetical protein